MKRIILDTNFLMIPGELTVDIFSEIERVVDFGYRLWIFDKTLAELEKLSKQKGKKKRYAKIGLELLHQKEVGFIPSVSDGDVDSILLLETDPKNDIIATQDMALKRKLRKKRYTLIVLRKKKYLNVIKT